MKYLFLLLAFSISSISMANEELDLAHECTPSHQAGRKLANGAEILPFRIYTVGYPVKAAFIQFEGGKQIPVQDISDFGPFTTYDTGSIAVAIKRNGNNSVGDIKYFGQDGNYYVDGVETYLVICSN